MHNTLSLIGFSLIKVEAHAVCRLGWTQFPAKLPTLPANGASMAGLRVHPGYARALIVGSP